MMSTGRFVHHELRVPDVAAGARFCCELFGWTATDVPVGTLLHAGDAPVAGVSAAKPNIPAHWSGYVAVDDVAATATTAKAHGGIVTTDDGEPVNAPGRGWLAPILDPTNKVVFVVTEPRPVGTEPAVGTVVWNRLHAADPAASVAFYQDVLPWTPVLPRDGASSGGGFRLDDGTTVADVVPAGEARPRWLPYIRVEDLDDTRARAVHLGATVLIERDRFPGNSGEFCVIADPQGAELGIYQVP